MPTIPQAFTLLFSPKLESEFFLLGGSLVSLSGDGTEEVSEDGDDDEKGGSRGQPSGGRGRPRRGGASPGPCTSLILVIITN